MFKGTKTIGTKDIDADLKLIDEQEKVREEMRAEMVKMRELLRRGEIDDLQKPESQTAALPRAGEAVRRARPEAARDHRQGPDRPDLHEERRRVPERLHHRGPDRLLHPAAQQQAGAVGLARVGPALEPGLPRVLLRARRGLRGAPAAHRVDAARQVRRGLQRALLGGASLPLAGGGLGLRHPDVHAGPGQGLLRDLLRAQQPHRGAGGRLQDRRGQAAARALLRPHPARARSTRRRW